MLNLSLSLGRTKLVQINLFDYYLVGHHSVVWTLPLGSEINLFRVLETKVLVENITLKKIKIIKGSRGNPIYRSQGTQ
jgi:hypothetical protein